MPPRKQSQQKQSLSIQSQNDQTQTLQQPETAVNTVPVDSKRHKLATDSGMYGGVQTVTSLRLKRRFCNHGYEHKMYIPDENYTRLSIIGVELGITLDEVIRGLIEQHLASNDQTSALKLFVPGLW